MGDVSGKGLPAAVQMATIVSMIEVAMLRSSERGPRAVIGEVERLMYRRLSDAAMFVTLAIGRWSASTRELSIVNSGHSPIVYCQQGAMQRVDATAPPIGVIGDLVPDLQTLQTRSSDILVLATDGFTEQTDRNGLLFGEDRFDDSVVGAASWTETAADLGHALLSELDRFSADCEQADDRALMVVRFT